MSWKLLQQQTLADAFGNTKNERSEVFSVPNFSFWLKEGVLSTRYMLFFATPSFRLPSHWVFRGALNSTSPKKPTSRNCCSLLKSQH
jgi:hypothetical protein